MLGGGMIHPNLFKRVGLDPQKYSGIRLGHGSRPYHHDPLRHHRYPLVIQRRPGLQNMNVPLNWLAEYVKLPKETKILTDKLTAVGHMLDKIKTVGKETVIDLELRGNRADMFGLIGVAREVAAITDSNLKMPEIPPLPKIDKNCPLLNVQPSAVDLVTRYTAVKLSVKVGPSPNGW